MTWHNHAPQFPCTPFCRDVEDELASVLERDARAVSGEEPYEVLYSIDFINGEMVSTGHYSLDILNEAYAENTRRDIEWLASRLHAKHCRQCDIVRSLIADLEGATAAEPCYHYRGDTEYECVLPNGHKGLHQNRGEQERHE